MVKSTEIRFSTLYIILNTKVRLMNLNNNGYTILKPAIQKLSTTIGTIRIILIKDICYVIRGD